MKEVGLVIIPLIVACSTFGAANGGIFYVSRYDYILFNIFLHIFTVLYVP